MLHSTYGLDFIYRQKLNIVKRLILSAYEKKQEERTWQMWLARLILMTDKDYMSYEEYRDKILGYTQQDIEPQTPEVVMNKVNNIIELTLPKEGR